MMSGIRGRNTQPEKLIRSGLHRLGFRFRLHAVNPSGRADFVLPKYHAAVYVHGCFWHGHDCHLFRLPGTRRAFWRDKIRANRNRDARVRKLLQAEGWRQLVIWECAFKGRGPSVQARTVERAAAWLRSSRRFAEIRGPRS
jgi:DNA mismatch endonuclease (patch repair protein)